MAEWTTRADPPVPEYARILVEGVSAHRERIDELLATYAVNWSLDRMPAVDRTVLRVGAYELLYAPEVPDAVAISEAVALVRELSTDESPTFVNGLLGRILQTKPASGATLPAAAATPATEPPVEAFDAGPEFGDDSQAAGPSGPDQRSSAPLASEPSTPQAMSSSVRLDGGWS